MKEFKSRNNGKGEQVIKINNIMKRLDQGHLHPLLEHPETNMLAGHRTRAACITL
jgi:hypothetical protein